MIKNVQQNSNVNLMNLCYIICIERLGAPLTLAFDI
jgi:hypothetical protein